MTRGEMKLRARSLILTNPPRPHPCLVTLALLAQLSSILPFLIMPTIEPVPLVPVVLTAPETIRRFLTMAVLSR